MNDSYIHCSVRSFWSRTEASYGSFFSYQSINRTLRGAFCREWILSGKCWLRLYVFSLLQRQSTNTDSAYI